MTGRGWVLNPKQTNKVKLFYFIELTVYQEERLQELLAKSRLGSGGQEDGTGGLDGRGGRVGDHRLPGQGGQVGVLTLDVYLWLTNVGSSCV